MIGTEDFAPEGVIPACLMPFDASFEIDQRAYRKHLRDLAGVEGIAAITINGHASEVHALSFKEQQRSLDLARDELGGRLPIVVGIWADSSLEASRLARMAEAGGADGLFSARDGQGALRSNRECQPATPDPVSVSPVVGVGLSLGYPDRSMPASAYATGHQGLVQRPRF